MTPRQRTLTRRALLAGACAGLGTIAGRQLASQTSPGGPAFPGSGGLHDGLVVLNDASELSPTPVVSHLTITKEPTSRVVERIRAALADARAGGRPFIASAARHSMGGQSLAANGTVLTFDQDRVDTDTTNRIYRVAAGTRWSGVIRQLDRVGFSPAVMQSNNDFAVASTFSVNAHGWPVPFSGCGSTVRAVRMVLPDGTDVRCSRDEHGELFRLAMGGYGLIGVITELELEMVPNVRLTPTFETMAGPSVGDYFAQQVTRDRSIQMTYGRMDVTLDRFLDEALLVTYRPTPDQTDLAITLGSGLLSRTSRSIFRSQVDSDRAKRFRWWMESSISPVITRDATRNALMNEPVNALEDRDPSRTDILHEYFVPPDRFAVFIAACKEVIPASYQQLLNITLRYVDTDHDSVLAYAPGPRIAAVLLFSQEKTVRGEADMARMTRSLIERVLDIGGTYYLPYRPHASVDQLRRGYARVADFVTAKQSVDPDLILRNHFWDQYLAQV